MYTIAVHELSCTKPEKKKPYQKAGQGEAERLMKAKNLFYERDKPVNTDKQSKSDDERQGKKKVIFGFKAIPKKAENIKER